MKNKILIITPDINRIGGVANHYLGLKKYWSKERVEYEYYGKRNNLPAFILLPYDLIKFIGKLVFKKPQVVLINPSLRSYQLVRDGIYLLLAKLFRVKIVTFFHGWDDVYIRTLIKKPGLFKGVYGMSNLIFVLCTQFKRQLIQTGIQSPIELTTTKVDDELLEGRNVRVKSKMKNILFLARIEENKGIFIAIEAFKQLKKSYKYLNLIIVGDGGALNKAKQKVIEEKIEDVRFTGRLAGEKIAEKYNESDIYILPTTHGEGMPTSVLEAMAFGLPIITRPVGGLNDFFEDGKMGYLIKGLDPSLYASAIKYYIENIENFKMTVQYNHKYALANFMASKVANSIENKIDTYV